MEGRRRRGRALARSAAAAVALAAAALLAAACGGPPAGGPSGGFQAGPPRPPPPLPDEPLYASGPDPGFYDTVASLTAGHQAKLAAGVLAIARTPTAFWAAGQPGEMQAVQGLMRGAASARAVPVIVAYNIPGRDACGRLSSDAGPGPAGYEAWIGQLAAAIGGGRAIVIVEPDAVPDIVNGCLSPAQAAQRYRLLSYAMERLNRLPGTRVYLDAGNPGMFADPSRVAGALERAGVRYGSGFSANVANFQWTDDVAAWSQRLEAALDTALGGGFGAVIDTGRNGNGPYAGPESPRWCNPPGRAPGPAPRLRPGPAGIDAYLWVKDPGLSDGPCNGGPAAGRYWAAAAEALARASLSVRQAAAP